MHRPTPAKAESKWGRSQPQPRLQAVLAGCLCTVLLGACSNADLYSATGLEPIVPDRVTLNGRLCTEDTSGRAFPAKILFVVDSSLEMFAADPSGERFVGANQSLDAVLSRFRNQSHVRFGFVGMAGTTQSFPQDGGQQFFRPQDPEIGFALAQMQAPLGTGRDMINALSQAGSFIAGDIADSTPGEVVRSRYLVSLLMAGPPQPSLPVSALAEQVEILKAQVYNAGALEFGLNISLAYRGPRTIDQGENSFECYPAGGPADPLCPCSATVRGQTSYCAIFCDVDSGGLTEDPMIEAREAYQAMAFAGDGVFREFPCPPAIEFSADIASSGVELVAKDIVAFNRNVKTTPSGPQSDSDGDGLTDIEEIATHTRDDLWDTDGDGMGDRVELRAFPQQNPNDPSDRPVSCVDPTVLGINPDRDLDLLTDCEEGILQARPSIADSDGDGLPDFLEFQGGTIPTSADDRLLDFDGDGIPNGDEVTNHTDPRANDRAIQGAEAYRTSITPLGLRRVADMNDPEELRGIVFINASPDVVGGQAYLRWDACSRTLEWSDARFPVGQPTFTPSPVAILASGEYRLEARSANDELIWIDVEVVLDFMPTCAEASEVIAAPLISVSDRNCYDVRLSNIKVMASKRANGDDRSGLNRIMVFMTQAPIDRRQSPGITSIAEVPVIFGCSEEGDGCTRDPSGIIELRDEMFISAEP